MAEPIKLAIMQQTTPSTAEPWWIVQFLFTEDGPSTRMYAGPFATLAGAELAKIWFEKARANG